jgi:hypothetical protein
MVLERTPHGEQQHQRRATLPLMEWMIMAHGTYVRSHGADIVFLDKAARKRIQNGDWRKARDACLRQLHKLLPDGQR